MSLKLSLALTRLRSTVVAPALGAVFSAPRLAASYIKGIFLIFLRRSDQANISESHTKNLSKSSSDIASIVDSEQKSFSKPTSDGSNAFDSPSFGVSKFFEDQNSVSDDDAIEFGKNLSDRPVISENKTVSYSKTISNTVSATDDVDGEASILDDQEMQFFKSVSNVSRISEVFTYIVSYIRSFTDSSSASDVPTLSVSKNLSDSSAIFENASLSIGNIQSDSSSVADVQSLNITKIFTDSLVVSDSSLSFALGKGIQNSIDVDENFVSTKGSSKTPSDNGSIGDNQVISIGKIVSDSGSIADSPTINFGKAPSDSGFISESFFRQVNYSRSFADSAFATDDLDGEASTLDDQEMQFTKVRTEIASVSESALKLAGKVASDSASATEAGSYRGQGYCSFDYFAEDYVGFSGTF